MSDEDKHQELEQRIAALTERIYRLELALGLPPQQAKTPAQTPPRPVGSVAPVPASPSLETRIGSQWFNRVGIVAVLFGVSYFLKYAFDNDWVGPSMRVVIGMAGGLALAGWSETLRRRGYASFSYSLTAVGIGVLYLSLWASSQLYQLIPIGLAFAAMTAVTAAAIGVALWQNAQIVAAFAMVGAFLTPLMLSTGENQAISLFSYVAILDAGVLILLRYRTWNRLLIGSYLGTLVLYVAWHANFYTESQFPVALVFLTVFLTAFAAVPWIARSGQSADPNIMVALVNAGIYVFQVRELFDHFGQPHNAAWVAVGLALVYFVSAYLLARTPGAIANVHWAIGIGLLIVAVPIGLESHWITIGWFVEAGALVWIAGRSQKDSLKYFGATALCLGVVRLLAIDNFEVSRLVFNHRLATFAVAIAVLAVTARLAAGSSRQREQRALPGLILAINLLAVFALNQEIADAYQRQLQAGDPHPQQTVAVMRDFAYSALWIAYGAMLMAAGFWKKSEMLRWQALVLIAVTIAKVFLYDTASLDRGYRIISFIALGLLLLTTSFLYQRRWFKVDER